MAITAVSAGGRDEYSLEDDRDSGAPTVFLLKVPSHRVTSHIDDNLMGQSAAGVASVRIMAMADYALRYCLVGWTNLLDSEGKPVPFKGSENGPTEEDLDRLPADVRAELFRRIRELGRPTPADFQPSAAPAG